MTESRQKRLNEETIRALWQAFGELKSLAMESGKVNDCSITKVAAKLGISKAYLTGTKQIQNQSINQSFREIGKAIGDFRVAFQKDKLEIKQTDTISLLKAENKALKSSFASYQLQYQGMNSQLGNLRRLLNQSERTIYDLQNDLHISNERVVTTSSAPITSLNRSSKVVIDTNSYRTRDLYGNLNHEASRLDAYDQLVREVKKNLNQRLYILVGPPSAGKSTWALNHEFPQDKHTIVLDDLNITMLHRRAVSQLIYGLKSLEVRWVWFRTPIEQRRKRNLEFYNSALQLNEKELEYFEKTYEAPAIENEPWIKSIDVIGGQSDN